MGFLFKNLRVYQQALAFADTASTLTAGFPPACWHVRDHLNRASLSIALNIAESTGRLTNAIGSAFSLLPGGQCTSVPRSWICAN